MRAVQLRVDPSFVDYLNSQRRLLARRSKAPEHIFTFPIMTLIITNKLKGNGTKLKINKRRIIIE